MPAQTAGSAVAAPADSAFAKSAEHPRAKPKQGGVVVAGGALAGAVTGAVVGIFAPLATEGLVDIEEGVLGGAVIGAAIGAALTWLKLQDD